MHRRPRQLHLVHGVHLTEQPPTIAAVDVPCKRTQALAARRFRAPIVACRSLPMLPRDELLRVDDGF